ncbi:carboxypeptidase regulatory-like domain-containing protein [Candidatus Bathyarchaeota archaeon]|nr:MAG: carboxypeptidase regulatory-like domain-containing protein [Candidatus Bathyarchaeota archaeon]
MRKTARASLLILALSIMVVPLFLADVHATSGCITSCLLKADTTVPGADGTVYVELDNNTGLVYPLPHTFSFANNSRHTLTVLNTTLSASSGARYVWNEWVRSSLQWTPTLMMQTPIMLYNYTGSLDGGPFTAKFDKQFQYTLTFKDAAGQSLVPSPTSVVLSSAGSSVTTSSYSGQWLAATSWTVTSATWEGYQGALPAPVPLDLALGSASAIVGVSAYPASVKVVDKLNSPIQGASVTITFANATSRTFTTDSQGTVQLGDIPIGPYSAHVLYQGQDQGTWSEDASVAPVSTVTLNAGGTSSAPVVSAIVLLTIFGVALFLILLAIKVRRPLPPPKI